MNSKNSFFAFLVYLEGFLLLMMVSSIPSTATNGACKMVSSLETCSWVDYNSWYPGLEPKDSDSRIGQIAKTIDDEDCKWAYTAYFCASSFAKCNDNQDGPLPVCRDTCENLINKCDPSFYQGITMKICDALPETECTSSSSKIWISPFLIILGCISIFLLY